jgi:DNA polymerase III epsilon subunit-like protein
MTSRTAVLPDSEPATRAIWLLDTETTGLSPFSSRIVELALLRYDDPSARPRSWLFSIGTPVPFSARAVHGICDEDLAGAPSFAAEWPAILSFVTAASSPARPLVVAHNASFDQAFVEAELSRAGISLPHWDWACSMRGVAHLAWPGAPAGLSALHDGDFDAHRAAGDCVALKAVLQKAASVLRRIKVAEEGEEGNVPSAHECLVDALEKNVHLRLLRKSATVVARNRKAATASSASAAATFTDNISMSTSSASPARSTAPTATSVSSIASTAVAPPFVSTASARTRASRQNIVPTSADVSIVLASPVAPATANTSASARIVSFAASGSLASSPPAQSSDPAAPSAFPTSPQSSVSLTTNIAVVYIVTNGRVWHKERSCARLSSSTEVETVAVAPSNRRACQVCATDAEPPACPVCCDDLASLVTMQLPCQHTFHSACIASWRNQSNTCPVCRAVAPAIVRTPRVDDSLRLGARAPLPSSPVTPPTRRELNVSTVEYYGTELGACYHVDTICEGLRNARNVCRVSQSGRRSCGVCVSQSSTAPQLALFAPPGDSATTLDALPLSSRAGTVASVRRPLDFSLADSDMFYGTEAGGCYHRDDACDGLRNARIIIPVSTDGRRPCRVCTLVETTSSSTLCAARALAPLTPTPRQRVREEHLPLARPTRVPDLRISSSILTSSMVTQRAASSTVMQNRTIFVCPTGKVWHASESCRGLRSAGSVVSSRDIPSGRRPCKVCVL